MNIIFCVAFVCNHCHWKNYNRRSMMGLTSHLYYAYNSFSSYCVNFSVMTSLTMMVLVPGHLVRALFHFALKILLVVSVEYFQLVVSVKKFRWLCQWNIKSCSNRRIYLTIKIYLTNRIDSTPQIIFPLKNIHSLQLIFKNVVPLQVFLSHGVYLFHGIAYVVNQFL